MIQKVKEKLGEKERNLQFAQELESKEEHLRAKEADFKIARQEIEEQKLLNE